MAKKGPIATLLEDIERFFKEHSDYRGEHAEALQAALQIPVEVLKQRPAVINELRQRLAQARQSVKD